MTESAHEASESSSGAHSAADSTSSVPTLSFGADGSVGASAPLVAGGKAIVHYDLARLPRCRATYMAFPAWDVEVSWAVDGAPARTAPLTRIDPATGARVATDVPLDVPFGHDLALWFHASDEAGCSEWDSDFGRNFHVPVAPTAPVLHFRSDWTVAIDGAPTAGSDLVVDYALERLPLCRQTYNGLQTWDVEVDWRVDGGPITQTSVTQSLDSATRVPTSARLHLPAGARTLEVWFENVDRTGCHRWDSAYGANYRFALAQPR
ncbi:MAG: hypothetical protein NVS3B10_15610 [Polyangiales bacterium]